jgi:hypothetical protein
MSLCIVRVADVEFIDENGGVAPACGYERSAWDCNLR